MENIDYSLLNKSDFLKEQKTRDQIFRNISDNLESKTFSDEYIQKQIEELFNWMNKFYGCSIQVFRGLAEYYECNKSISEMFINNYHKDMPKYLSNAITYFCDNIKG